VPDPAAPGPSRREEPAAPHPSRRERVAVPPREGSRPDPAPDGEAWVPASPRLVTARVVTALVVTPLPIAAGVVLATLVSPWWWFLAAPFALGLASTLLRSRRHVAALGYAERAEELVVREGLWSRTTTVVPYGRLQYVTLTEGPIDTRLGLARLEVHTAATGSTTVPGLPVAEARALRSRLSRRTHGRDEGL